MHDPVIEVGDLLRGTEVTHFPFTANGMFAIRGPGPDVASFFLRFRHDQSPPFAVSLSKSSLSKNKFPVTVSAAWTWRIGKHKGGRVNTFGKTLASCLTFKY